MGLEKPAPGCPGHVGLVEIRGLEPLPLACRAIALPTELYPQKRRPAASGELGRAGDEGEQMSEQTRWRFTRKRCCGFPAGNSASIGIDIPLFCLRCLTRRCLDTFFSGGSNHGANAANCGGPSVVRRCPAAMRLSRDDLPWCFISPRPDDFTIIFSQAFKPFLAFIQPNNFRRRWRTVPCLDWAAVTMLGGLVDHVRPRAPSTSRLGTRHAAFGGGGLFQAVNNPFPCNFCHSIHPSNNARNHFQNSTRDFLQRGNPHRIDRREDRRDVAPACASICLQARTPQTRIW